MAKDRFIAKIFGCYLTLSTSSLIAKLRWPYNLLLVLLESLPLYLSSFARRKFLSIKL